MPVPSHTVPTMTYANWIQEDGLKKTFIIATLISSVIGCFATGVNLHDRLQERKQQKKVDHKQNDEIGELRKRVEKAEEERNKLQQKSIEHDRYPQRALEYDLRGSLRNSGPMIQQEYDRDFARLGPKFGEGDYITQNQLQGHIITMQGTVIGLLEDAIQNGHRGDINKLYNASEFAREGSIRALKDQYQRMMQQAPIQRPLGPIRRTSSDLPYVSGSRKHSAGRAITNGPVKSIRFSEDDAESTRTMSYSQNVGGRDVPQTITSATRMFDEHGPLFCKYAEKLQDTNAPLHDNFSSSGCCSCPSCGTRILVQPGRSWRIDKELVHEKSSRHGYEETFVEERSYYINNRFLVKCHREGAGFACLLCQKYRDSDTVCETVQRLVNHIWKKHSAAEYANEPDIGTKH